MHQRTDSVSSASRPVRTIRIASRSEISGSSHWRTAFARERKDHRYYELVEDTLKESFKYGYFIIETNRNGCAIQPYFLVDQDLLAGISGPVRKLIAGIRRFWPRFMCARTLMVGCAAGEGHLDGDEATQSTTAALLAQLLPQLAELTVNCPCDDIVPEFVNMAVSIVMPWLPAAIVAVLFTLLLHP